MNNINNILRLEKYFENFTDKFILNDDEKIGFIYYIQYLKDKQDNLNNIKLMINDKIKLLQNINNTYLTYHNHTSHNKLYKNICEYIYFLEHINKLI